MRDKIYYFLKVVKLAAGTVIVKLIFFRFKQHNINCKKMKIRLKKMHHYFYWRKGGVVLPFLLRKLALYWLRLVLVIKVVNLKINEKFDN